MVDGLGNSIRLGFADHEIEWIKVAVSLPRGPLRAAAFRDICALTGRHIEAVRQKGYHIEKLRLDAIMQGSKTVMVPARVHPVPQRRPHSLPPSSITVDPRRLVGRRA